MRFSALAAALVNLTLVSSALADPAKPEPYALPDTQVHAMHSQETGADYQLLIATPPNYQTSGKKYPVVYMLDADYSFALTRNVVRHFVERGKLPEMILVAIAYPGAADDMEIYRRNRKRDYTPSLTPISTATPAPATEAQQGGAVRFRNFIADEVMAYVANKFPVSADRTFIGHSYGGLFGAYVLLTEPELFTRYVLISPSLWWDNRMIFRLEQKAGSRAIAGNTERHVFLAIGALETRDEMGAPMVDQLKQFYGELRARREPGLQIDMRVYPDESHASIFPSAVTGGLLAVFPPPQS